MKTTIVTTTINIPVLLTKYAENARYYGHTDLDMIVIGDRKSPAETAAFCNSVPHYRCEYMDIPAQQKYMDRFPDLWSHLRFDSIQRRNIGLLWAYENGADVVITIDDDNFVMNQDFVGLHGVVGSRRELLTYGSTSGWFNVCSLLETDDNVKFYHRGYPQKMRWTEANAFISSHRAEQTIAVNAGFWLDNPDIDALTRMERQLVVRGLRQPWQGNFALHPGTWSPFNSQNTALMRDVLPAYFLSPYIGRYDDIWASYVIMRISEHFGHVVSFGEPAVRQERNPHDLWKDLDVERNGMIMTDDFCAALRSIPLSGSTYHECFAELASALPAAWQEGPKFTESQKQWRNEMIRGMEIWHQVFDKLGVHGTPELSEVQHHG
ncbi:MAG: hypothetical protein JO022_15070 [Acidobacteriaceae bacterium]|nr:hypothetical protein [Acidobacteriaceae bacterium]